MSLKILVDMNLSPEWVPYLAGQGWSVSHWASVGDPKSPDAAIMAWALSQGHVVFTHDLDFGHLLALTHASGPSVLQVRTENVLPEHIGPIVLNTLKSYEIELTAGALIVVDEARARVRILPIK